MATVKWSPQARKDLATISDYYREYIAVDPHICHGKACIKGTRVLVSVVLDNLAAGLSAEEIIQSYPSVSAGAVQAVLSYAADVAGERVLAIPA